MNAAARLRWRVSGAIFTAAILVLGAAGFSTAVLDEPGVPMALVDTRTTETVRDEYLLYTPQFVLVDHSGPGVPIDIEHGTGDRVVIERETTWARERPDQSQSWDGQTLTIDSGGCMDCTVRYRITLPEHTEVIRRG
ncbi:hypothetical protein FDA94_11985 [Herbidospora galbida]|uniref:Uncharacterized protein n=1 Tax=Herbidospora galbida TaxID=2575442 RepID=A0A4U3MJD1_9ACTN|nr:hypothetical protein [Herbidospora galbida]TKK88799.1 hypothetical protein FDA94_11985 [Herbidospora galbida]